MTDESPYLEGPQFLAALKAIAEPTRLRLLRACHQGELTVGELTRITGQSQPVVSRHLKILCDAGLLVRFRERHWVFYRVQLSGTGARLVRRLLQILNPEDDDSQLDQQRLKEVLDERAQLASGYSAELRPPPVGDRQLAQAVSGLLGPYAIGDLLDIGTGTGRLLRFLADEADQAIGVDISSEMLMIARTNLHAAGLGQCMVRHANMYQLPFTNASFDTVTIDQVLAEADDPAAAIREAARILRTGGRLLLIEDASGEGAHRGEDAPRLHQWLKSAGLRCDNTLSLPEDRAALVLCVGHKQSQAEKAA